MHGKLRQLKFSPKRSDLDHIVISAMFSKINGYLQLFSFISIQQFYMGLISLRKILYSLIYLVSFLLSSVFANAQEIKFKHLSVREGLSQSTVNSIIKDKYGFMWFGTQDGLNKYDGYKFSVYKNNPLDSNSISDNFINCLVQSSDGDIWIATANGLNRFKPEEEIFVRYNKDQQGNNNPGNQDITAVLQDDEGNIWATTWGAGLKMYEKGTGKVIRFLHNETSDLTLISNIVLTIFQDSKKRIWIGTRDGLCLFNKKEKTFRRYKHDPKDKNSLSGNHISAISEDISGKIWIGTYGFGLNSFDYDQQIFTQYHFDQNTEGTNITAMTAAHNGGLWVATNKGGMKYFDPLTENFETFLSNKNKPETNSYNNIISIYGDSAGILWIGTYGGINIYDPKQNRFSHYKNIIDSEKKNIELLFEDKSGNLWIGANNRGLIKLDRRSGNFESLPDKLLTGKSVQSLTEDSKNNFWLGTKGQGLIKFNLKSRKFFIYRNNPADTSSISSNYICKVYEDRKGNIWAGTTYGGLNKYDSRNDSFTRYSESAIYDPDKVIGKTVFTIYEDKSGNLWVGTWGSGVTKLDQKNFKHKRYLNDKNDTTSLSNNSVFSITEDKKGNLFFGTWGGGLNMYRDASDDFIHFDNSHGLPNNVIYGILNDAGGNLWLSTNFGLCRFNPYTGEYKNYTEADGLQGNEFNQGAYCLSKTGEMFFGGLNGFNRFYPDSIFQSNYMPPVVLTEFQIFNQPVAVSPESPLKTAIYSAKKVILSYDQNVFSFQFAALDYNAPELNQYAYRMEGFDDDWIYSGTRRFATYTNLDPGKYIFHVKATNSDGIWNNRGTRIAVIITPPWWQTWWFRTIIIAGFLAIGPLIYYRRVTALKKEKKMQEEFSRQLIHYQEEERKRIASGLHDSLGQNLLIIKNRALLGLKSGETGFEKKQLSEISENASSSIEEVRRIAYNLHPYHLERLGLTKAIYSIIDNLEDSTGINFKIEADNIDAIFKPGEEINLYRIVQECINNIVKHSASDQAVINIQNLNNTVTIKVEDNGKGFYETPGEKNGFGLKNIQERVKLLHGEFNIESSENKGTILMIRIPVNNGR